LSGLNSGREVPKTIFDSGGQGCRITSVLGKLANRWFSDQPRLDNLDRIKEHRKTLSIKPGAWTWLRGGYLDKRESLILMGNRGNGKTQLATGLGVEGLNSVPDGLHATLTAVLCGTYLIVTNKRANNWSGIKVLRRIEWREERFGKGISILGIRMCP
jgi:hypothetical protein